jgi:hypothetical protein
MPAASFEAQKDYFKALGGPSSPMAKMMGPMLEKFKEMKGVPLATTVTVKMLGKAQTTTSEVTELKKGAVPAAAFEIPAGYKKVDSPAAKFRKKK